MNTTIRSIVGGALALSVSLTAALPAAADANPAWPIECQSAQAVLAGKWQWVVNFNGGKAKSCMVAMSSTSVPTFSIASCRVFGAVSIGNGTALFNGGYLTCTFDPPGAGSTGYPEFDMTARAMVAKADSSPVGNPIFVHPYAGLYLPRLSMTSAGMSSKLNGVVRTTWEVVPGGLAYHTYRTTYVCGGTCTRAHYGDSVLKTTFSDSGNASFTRDAATVYIGLDPSTGLTYAGYLDDLIVDPAVRPDCC